MRKLDAKNVFAFSPKLKEPCLINDLIFWLEQRPSEAGRTTLLVSRWGENESISQELTPSPSNLKTRIHGYGGGAYSVQIFEEQVFIAWIDDFNGCLWTQSWEFPSKQLSNSKNILSNLSQPICLSQKGDFFLGDGILDLNHMQWLGVMEKEGKDFLVSFSLLEKFQEPLLIYEAKDFIGYITLSPNSKKLAWVEWQRPFMPWDQSGLYLADLSNKESISNIIFVAGSDFDQDNKLSVFQPCWLNNNQLLFSEDSNGWWNITLVKINNEMKLDFLKISNIREEFASPQWIAGMSTISCYDDQIVALSCNRSKWNLNLINNNGVIKKIALPFEDLSYLNVCKGHAIMVAGNPFIEEILLEVDLKDNTYEKKIGSIGFQIPKDCISVGKSLWFEGYNKCPTHAWYYSPVGNQFNQRPLLVKVHSGPTSMVSRGLDRSIQFWTSRGWTVVDVNYSGSTGFGREYRDRLQELWGEADAFDCYSAAMELVSLGKVNKDLIVIAGSSAGGFTALSCLAKFDIFRAASCKYPVTDLLSMRKHTHRFEEFYLQHLVGYFSNNKKKYIDFSPINNVDNINSPTILFHGLQDKVVDFHQVENIFKSLRVRNVDSELHTFENEGHGFRDLDVNIKVLNLMEKFFNKYLGI